MSMIRTSRAGRARRSGSSILRLRLGSLSPEEETEKVTAVQSPDQFAHPTSLRDKRRRALHFSGLARVRVLTRPARASKIPRTKTWLEEYSAWRLAIRSVVNAAVRMTRHIAPSVMGPASGGSVRSAMTCTNSLQFPRGQPLAAAVRPATTAANTTRELVSVVEARI